MTKTREKGEQFTSPTSDAPILAGFDGADGGRDALELARDEAHCPVLVVPHSRQV